MIDVHCIRCGCPGTDVCEECRLTLDEAQEAQEEPDTLTVEQTLEEMCELVPVTVAVFMRTQHHHLEKANAEIERLRKAFTPVTEAEWDAARAREREEDTHPCDHHSAETCFCKGACSCHWVSQFDVQRMREALSRKPPVTNEQGPGHLLVGTTEDGYVSIQFINPDWWVHFTPREAVLVALKILRHAEAADGGRS